MYAVIEHALDVNLCPLRATTYPKREVAIVKEYCTLFVLGTNLPFVLPDQAGDVRTQPQRLAQQ